MLCSRINALFNISRKNHENLTDLEKCYVFLFIVLMAKGEPQFSLEIIRKEIGMDEEEYKSIVDNCIQNGLLDYEQCDKGGLYCPYSISGVLAHFAELRSTYIHQPEMNEQVVEGIYKVLETAYYYTDCHPSMTFISLRGDREFRSNIMARFFVKGVLINP